MAKTPHFCVSYRKFLPLQKTLSSFFHLFSCSFFLCIKDLTGFCALLFTPFRILTVRGLMLGILRHFSQFSPSLFDRSSIAQQNLSNGVNDICDGSPSRILIVLLISLGMTTLPRSSILLTIPVAFIYINPYLSYFK